MLTVSLEHDPQFKRGLQQRLTVLLPEWFNQGEANLKYADTAQQLDGYVARIDGDPKGLLIYKKHSAIAAEIVWLGVDPNCHRCGIGRALVTAACDAARSDGLDLLFAWTLHAKIDYEPYKRTRRFYDRVGFQYAMEEHSPDETNPLALYVRRLR
jgi:GNAT superfamily N-acetyltransferase